MTDTKSDKTLLQFADKVTEISCQLNIDSIPIPQLIVVGAQSSGKSSLINKLVGYDLLPIGESMVTRTPIHIRLHHAGDTETGTATLSVLDNGTLKTVYRMAIDDKTCKMDGMQANIASITDKITLNKFSISKTPIFIDINSPRVTNISFVDLPGLVTIACTDKGQSETIVNDIKDLIGSQLSKQNTIVMVVVQSKNDLETDIGLALVKELQRTQPSIKTIGILTKPDLLDKQQKLNDIVAGKISKSVMLDDGYFVVNNKTDDEHAWFERLFHTHSQIISGKRYGVRNLLSHIQKYLVNVIKENLPNVRHNLTEVQKKIKMRVQQMGTEIKDTDNKIGYTGRIIYQLNQSFINSLESKGTVPNGGYEVKKIFQDFIENTNKLNPFAETELEDAHIQTIIDSFDGYHMTTQASIIQLLERCIGDRKIRPVMTLLPHISSCIQRVVDLIEVLARELLVTAIADNVSLYPRLKETIVTNLVTLIKSYGSSVNDDMVKHLTIQEDFIWTSNAKFQEMVTELINVKNLTKQPVSEKPSAMTFARSMNTGTQLLRDRPDDAVMYCYNVSQIRQLAKQYFTTVITCCQDMCIKSVVSGIIKRLEREFSMTMTKQLIGRGSDAINELFWEDPEVAKERNKLIKNLEKIQETIDIVNRYVCIASTS